MSRLSSIFRRRVCDDLHEEQSQRIEEKTGQCVRLDSMSRQRAKVAARSIKAFLFDVSTGRPKIFVAAISTLARSGLIAALLPARRAVSIEPV